MDTDGEFEKRAVCVTVNQSRRIVTGLDWSTTAQDLISSVRPRSEPQVLLESWRGCMRPIGKNEYVCQILEQWGEEARNVQLVLMSATSYAGYQSRPGLLRNKIYRAQTHGKVASNRKKCLSRCSFQKKKVVSDIERLMEAVRVNKERLKVLEEPVKQGMIPEPPIVVEGLTATEEEEWVGLQEELEEEKLERESLFQRRAEIKEKIEQQSTEMEQQKRTNAELQAKLALGKERVERLKGALGSRESEAAQEEIQRLQNEIKVKMKINQLQSTKAKELSASITKTEEDTRDCIAQIEELKFAK